MTNEFPFDAPLSQQAAAYELQRPVEAISPLAEALDRVGIGEPTKSELLDLTGLTAALVDKTWVAVKLADGDVGMLVCRLRLAAKAAGVPKAAETEAESKPSTWEVQAKAATELRLAEIRRCEQEAATARDQMAMIDPAELARCAKAVLDNAPWLRKLLGSCDPFKSRILGALTLNYWRRQGRMTPRTLFLETGK